VQFFGFHLFPLNFNSNILPLDFSSYALPRGKLDSKIKNLQISAPTAVKAAPNHDMPKVDFLKTV